MSDDRTGLTVLGRIHALLQAFPADPAAAAPRFANYVPAAGLAEGGPLQLSLFDEQDLAEITADDFPGERLIACRNPVLAAERSRKREDLLAATETLLVPIAARVTAGRLADAGPIGVEVGKVISKYKTAKHFQVTITDDTLIIQHRHEQIGAEAALDGFCALRTPVPASHPCSRR